MGLLKGQGMHQAVECKSKTSIRSPGRVSAPHSRESPAVTSRNHLEEFMASGHNWGGHNWDAGSLGFTQVAPALKIYLGCLSAKSQLLRRPTVADKFFCTILDQKMNTVFSLFTFPQPHALPVSPWENISNRALMYFLSWESLSSCWQKVGKWSCPCWKWEILKP